MSDSIDLDRPRPALREYHSATVDSTRWNGFRPRPDDIIVATYPKCGTTWTQRIVDLLLHQSPEPREFMAASPWIDATIFGPLEAQLATLEAQTGRRFVKSHLPFDGLPVFEGVKYIHTARDGRDACLSMHNHQLGFRPEMRANIAANAPPGAVLPPETPEDPREFFLQWMDRAEAGGVGDSSEFCSFEQSYWDERRREALLMVHYADLKADLEGEMRRISDFLEIDTPASLMPALTQAARFETMKAQGETMMPQLRMAFDHGSQRFINKGENGRWRAILTDEDLARYDVLIANRLSKAHAAWIEGGRLAAGDPRTSPG